MSTKTTVRERIDTSIVGDITIAPDDRYTAADRYGVTDDGRYRYAATDRYTAADSRRYRYAAPDRHPSRYDRYAAADRYAKPGTGRKLVRRIVHVTPPPRTEGQLLWLPSSEYERSFEGFEAEEVWELGCVVDFDEAAEAAQWQGYDDDDDCRLYAVGVGSERETFVADDWWHDGSSLWPELMEQALKLRMELAADPDQVVQVLKIEDLRGLAIMVGSTEMPMHHTVADAIASDPTSGLGGAALDSAVWRMPGLFGHSGADLAAQLEILRQEEWVRLDPVENLLLHTGTLHPGTIGAPGVHRPEQLFYPLHGMYVVSKISYTSDLTGKVVGGWRSVYLEPVRGPESSDD